MEGFFIVDKPAGLTSQNVCTKIKKTYNLNKVGHNGTLDPQTTGVMVVACNRATKMLQYLVNDDKEYLTTIIFGLSTNTLDIYGSTLATSPVIVDMPSITEALKSLKNKTTQVPPLVSAIKVNGKKLYEYERKNLEVEINERKVTIHDIKVIRPLYMEDGQQRIDLLLDVSKGFYVRSFARDLGELLGTYAVMGKLRRTRAGKFCINDAIPLANIIEETKTPLAIDEVFSYPKIEINNRILNFVKNGVTLYKHNLEKDCKIKDVSSLSRFILVKDQKNIAIYEKKDEIYRPIFIF